MAVNFFDFHGLYDGSWLLFALVAALSRSYGKNALFKKLQVPTITGYMFMGFICGPYVLKVLNVEQVEQLGYVNKVALSFIAFSAGAEMHWHEIAPLMKSILYVSAGMTIFTMIFATLFTFSVGQSSLLSWLGEYSGSCGISVSLLVATILSARSPTSVLAVVRELKAKGPVTDMLVAITVGGDIIVLTLFAINLGIARNMCSGESFDAAGFFIDIVLIGVAFIFGALVGGLIIACLDVPHMTHAILPIGFITYLLCDYILAVSEESSEYPVGIDALLVCISAGFVATNFSKPDKREKLIDYLKKYAKYVFIPFFTCVGVNINLPVLIKTLGFSIIACIIRALCMMMGTVSGGHFAKLGGHVSCMLWMGLIPQAGVSLGLAGVVASAFLDTFGSEFQSTIVGIILINQVIGPIGAKYLLKKMKEDGKGEGGTNVGGLRIFVGDLDKPRPAKGFQTIAKSDLDFDSEIDEEEGDVIRTAKPREISPQNEFDMATTMIDAVVQPIAIVGTAMGSVVGSAMSHVPGKMFYQGSSTDASTEADGAVQNPMFAAGNGGAVEEYNRVSMGIEMTENEEEDEENF